MLTRVWHGVAQIGTLAVLDMMPHGSACVTSVSPAPDGGKWAAYLLLHGGEDHLRPSVHALHASHRIAFAAACATMHIAQGGSGGGRTRRSRCSPCFPT